MNRDSESELQLSESGESLVKESRASDSESDSPLLDDRESMTKIKKAQTWSWKYKSQEIEDAKSGSRIRGIIKF